MSEVKRGRPAKDNQAVTFKLSKNLVERLNDYASESGASKVDIVEDALKLYFEENKVYVFLAEMITEAYLLSMKTSTQLDIEINRVLSGIDYNRKCREVIYDVIKDYATWNKIVPTSKGGLRVTRNLVDENITLDDLVNRNYTPDKTLVSDVIKSALGSLLNEQVTEVFLTNCQKTINDYFGLSYDISSYNLVKETIILKNKDIIRSLCDKFENEHTNLSFVFNRYNPNMPLFRYEMTKVLKNISIDF